MAWHLIARGNGYNSNYMEFLIDSDSDISSPPENYHYAPTSIAHTPGYAKMWEADAEGEWVEIGGEA